MDSNRLPNKPLRKIKGYPMLYFLIERMRHTPGIDGVVVATTKRPCDEPLVQWACEIGIDTFRGDLKDVLGRYAAAASYADADIVIKANGDSPLLAPEVVTAGFHEMNKHGYEFVTGKNAYTGLPIGLGAEIIKYETLNRLNQEVDKPLHREQITTFIFENPQSFKWAPIPVQSAWVAPELNLTVDTPEDFWRISKIINSLANTVPYQWSIKQIISAYREQISP
jgi:spore coat polysaccharide biosynthesis protein SpsF